MCWQISILSFCFLLMQKVPAQKVPDSIIIKTLIQNNEAAKTLLHQFSRELSELKTQLQKQQTIGYEKFTNTFLFLDAAISSANNLQALIIKESYRNKIASLNNPTSNELGFNLEVEIQNALKPLLQKTKKTSPGKFGQVISSFLNTGKSSLSLFPAGNLFTSILGMAGGLALEEKKLNQQDLDNFIKSIEKYFNQYERLNQSNLVFNTDMEKLKSRLRLLQDDMKFLLQDLILALDKNLKRQQLKSINNEELMLTYFDNKKIQAVLSKAPAQAQFPQDAVKSCKEIANNIQRIYEEYAEVYNNNFKEIKGIISDSKNMSVMVDQLQLNKTLRELEGLYTESKNIDNENLRLKTLFERLELVIQ